jgi:hypothetical protein
MRLRVEVEGEPFAPGAAVSGRVMVEEGGGARSLSVRLAFVERTESFEKVARDAGIQVVAEGDLADSAVLVRAAAPRQRPPEHRHAARAHRLGAARPRRSRGSGPDRRPADRAAAELHCPGPGEVAEWLKALAC